MQTFPGLAECWRGEKWSDQRHLPAVLPLARKTERFQRWKPPVCWERPASRGGEKAVEFPHCHLDLF